MLNKLRLRYGLHWQRRTPNLGEMKRSADTWLGIAAALAVILLAYGIVGRLDYEEELRQEKEMYLQAVLACLNHGGMVFDREAFECRANSIGIVR